MDTFKQRVIDEKTQLDERLNKLETFIKADAKFQELSMSEQYWLGKQAGVMQDYSFVLGERIKRFI